ncbi:two-component regulator propeller domain-containing protein [uncultured Cytophaga sp.]|uniref:DUF7619 domain-containing protein n=1 Tax=uncultured Cytophaga sp. TaxID=160238 RepID=UPI00262A0B38|nr:two-component regulator propeller domain-containing protein [uncultured Cytophaga sp.]
MKKTFLFLLLALLLCQLILAQEFTNYTLYNTATNTFKGNNIKSLHQTKSGSLFLITDGGISSNYNNVWKTTSSLNDFIFQVEDFYEIDGDTILLLMNGQESSKMIVAKYNYATNTIKRDSTHAIEKYLNIIGPSCIEMDGDGNFWVGTQYQGLSIVNKDSLVVQYTYDFFNNTSPIGTNEISTIYKDLQDNMWVGTQSDGLYKFDGLNWTHYIDIFKNESSSLRANRINQIIQDANTFWVATDFGLVSFDGTQWKKSWPINQIVYGPFMIYSINIDSENVVWAGSNYGLYTLKNDVWESKIFPDIVSNTYTFNKIQSIQIDDTGTKWLGTDYGIVEYSDAFVKRTVTDGYEATNAFSIQIDKQDNVWIGHYLGISKYDGSTWSNYNRYHGVLESTYNFAIDSKNQKWLAGQYGAWEFNDADTSIASIWGFYGPPLKSSTVNEIKISSTDHVWVASDDGLSHYDLNNWTSYTTADGLPHNRVRSLAIDKNDNVWIGTDNGLARLSPDNTWYYYNPGSTTELYSNYVLNICIDKNNNVWCSSPQGLQFFDGVKWTVYNFPAFVGINDIKVDAENVIWVCAYDAIYKFDGEVWEIFKDFLDFSSNIYEMAIDQKGNKWLCLDGNSIVKFNDNGPGSKATKNKVFGYVFNDINNNGIKDTGEKGIRNQIIQLTPNNFVATDKNGQFITYANLGTNSFVYRTPRNWIATTDTIKSFAYSQDDVVDTIYFGIEQDENVVEYGIDIMASRSRTSFDSHYWIDYYNFSIQEQTVTVKFKVDTLVDIKNITPTPSSIDKNVITWNSFSMKPYETGQFHISAMMPDFNFAGDTLLSYASMFDDLHIAKDTLRQILTNSFDPNDKQVREGFGNENYVLMGTQLKYTIRFQNTGTDTAYNVVIKDMIDANLDLTSLSIVGSSHACKLKVYGKNMVSFIFENINLPHQTMNDSASNGFVSFVINPLSSEIEEKETVSNSAEIYFDFNPPIYTNKVSNVYVTSYPSIVVTSTKDKMLNEIHNIVIYPNPTQNNFTIHYTGNADVSIVLIDVMGSIILQKEMTTPTETINTLCDQAPGMYQIIIYDKNQGVVGRSKIIKL